MFSFNLPKFAALQVTLPTGGSTLLVHAGDGRFLSKVPPIVLAGCAPAGHVMGANDSQAVSWDGATLPGDGDAAPVVFGFDLQGAARAVEEAAAAGDTFARSVLDEMAAAEATLAAQERLGMAATPAAESSAEDINEARAIVGLGPVKDGAPA